MTTRVHAPLRTVPGPVRDLAEVLDGTPGPVLVLPPRAPSVDPRTAPVLLGAGPATPPEAVDLAFAEAAHREVPVLAVRAWRAPGVDLGRPLPDPIAAWDEAECRVREALAAQLSAAAARHPGVPVRLLVIEDDPAALLLALAGRAQLAVLGPPGTSVPGVSPAAVLARRARCPVAYVPAGAGTDRRRR